MTGYLVKAKPPAPKGEFKELVPFKQNMTFQIVSGEWSVVSEYRIFRVITHHLQLTTHDQLSTSIFFKNLI